MIRLPLASVLHEWAEVRRFNALDPCVRSIVFYAEDAASWVHFEPMIRELTGPMGREICYLTSSPDDPVLSGDYQRIHAFYIGDGIVRTALFMMLKAGALVMTVPDLETFHIKRSRVHPVHYVYVFHAIVSTHMVYRRGAFDHYDTVLCVGPHHIHEIRETERVYGLKPKHLVEHGYGRLDSIRGERSEPASARFSGVDRKKRVLVAPSWGPEGLLETHGLELTGFLLEAGCQVTVRPHPETRRKWPRVMRDLQGRFGTHPDFGLEEDVASAESLRHSDVMISDWSGAALEYAFGFERPVLFVDVPRKINNPDYQDIPCAPLEVTIRESVGRVISPDHLHEVERAIEALCADSEAFRRRIRQARSRTVFNLGGSGVVGASCIARIADEATGERTTTNDLVPVAS